MLGIGTRQVRTESPGDCHGNCQGKCTDGVMSGSAGLCLSSRKVELICNGNLSPAGCESYLWIQLADLQRLRIEYYSTL
jgi:hypothetical protein